MTLNNIFILFHKICLNFHWKSILRLEPRSKDPQIYFFWVLDQRFYLHPEVHDAPTCNGGISGHKKKWNTHRPTKRFICIICYINSIVHSFVNNIIHFPFIGTCQIEFWFCFLQDWKDQGLPFSSSSDEVCKLYDAAVTQVLLIILLVYIHNIHV